MSLGRSSEDNPTGVVKGDSFRLSSFSKGSVVEADYKNRGTFNPGQIISIKVDGTYDVEYDDGVIELSVREENIRERKKIVFPQLLKYHHLFFFGGNTRKSTYFEEKLPYTWQRWYWMMPYLWIALGTVGILFFYLVVFRQDNPYYNYKAIIVTSLYVESVANFWFAKDKLQISDLREVLDFLRSESRQRSYLLYLQIIWALSFAFSIVFTVGDVQLYREGISPLRLFSDIFVSLFGYWNTFYICGIWNWLSFIVSEKYFEVLYIKLSHKDDLSDYIKLLIKFSDDVNRITGDWSINHWIRLFSGLLITIGYTQMVYYHSDSVAIGTSVFFMICYYWVIFGTLICAANETRKIKSRTLSQLSRLLWKQSNPEDMEVISNMITTVPIIFKGVRVAGIHLTFGKAVTTASTLITVLFAFTKLHTLYNSGGKY